MYHAHLVIGCLIQWEDPEVDMQHLNLTKDDALFVITSAGDSELLCLEFVIRRRRMADNHSADGTAEHTFFDCTFARSSERRMCACLSI